MHQGAWIKNKTTIGESNLENLFECAYFFLLVDQYEDGLWGKSITTEDREKFSGHKEVQASKERKRAESITVTFFAVDAIYTFTKNPKNPAIERALNSLSNHKGNGGYGSFKGLISAYPIPKSQIMISCRHTTTALLTYLLFQDSVDEKISESVKFLINHTNKDGGWGVTVDLNKSDSDCLTTAYVVKLLTNVEKMGIKDILKKRYSPKLDKAITSGLGWLERDNKENGGFWFFQSKDMKVQYSAVILATFHELTNYKKELHERTLHRIASLQKDSGGWPMSLEGRAELNSTIWAVSALINSDGDAYTKQIEQGIGFITGNISKWSYAKTLNTADWAALLKLADYEKTYISHELDSEIQELTATLNEKVSRDEDVKFVRKKLPARFRLLREPILGGIENRHPDIFHRNFIEKLADRTPLWLRWLLTVIILGIMLGIITNFIYDFLTK